MSSYIPGEWNIVCDVCSKEIKASQSKHRWDGFIVCIDCWEPRHPQDFLKVRNDKISVPFTRPEPADVYITVPYISTVAQGTPIGLHGIADYGQASMAQVGKLLNGVL